MKLPNGWGSVTKLSGKRRKPWRVRKTVGFEIDPETKKTRQIYQTIGYYATKKEGLEALAEFNKKPWDSNHDITLAEVYEIYTQKKFKEISDSGIKGIKAAWKYFQPLYTAPIRLIRADQIQEIIDSTEKSRAHLSNMKAIMVNCMEWAVQNDIMDKNYAEFVKLPKKTDRVIERVPFSADEIRMLWDMQGDLTVDILLILLYSGMRVNELLGMKRDCCHIEEGYFDIQNSKTDAGVRQIPIHHEIKPIIEFYFDKGSTYLLSTENAPKVEYVNLTSRSLPKINSALNSTHHFHDTRHTFISRWKEQGLDELYLKKIVGHQPGNVTEKVYTHIKLETLNEALQSVSYRID